MKRDMDIVLRLLRLLESRRSDEPFFPSPSDLPGQRPPEDVLREHCRLIVERGLARGESAIDGWVLTGLTWEGHDFLDNSRESKVWKAAKKAAGDLSFGVFVRVLTETATRYAMSRIIEF